MYLNYIFSLLLFKPWTGADPGFQVRGEGTHLKKSGISCEKSRFYTKKTHIFSNFRWGAPWIRPCLTTLQNCQNTHTTDQKKLMQLLC